MMLYKNLKASVRSPGWDSEFFKVEAGILQGNT